MAGRDARESLANWRREKFCAGNKFRIEGQAFAQCEATSLGFGAEVADSSAAPRSRGRWPQCGACRRAMARDDEPSGYQVWRGNFEQLLPGCDHIFRAERGWRAANQRAPPWFRQSHTRKIHAFGKRV